MADEWYETTIENEHDVVNAFLRSKETTGRSPRTVNEYSRTLYRFYPEHFPDLHPADTEVRHLEEYLHILGLGTSRRIPSGSTWRTCPRSSRGR